MQEVKLPEIGENITSGTVLSINVNVGDSVKSGQDLLELETDKATIPVPAPCDGAVKEILVKIGDNVKVGAVIVRIEESGPIKTSASAKPAAETKQEPAKANAQAAPAPAVASKPIQQQEAAPAQSHADLKDLNIVVVGGGPGGYAAAFLAADLGMKITLIDKDVNPGGVCLYRGCIPSKALLHAAKILSEAKEAHAFGVDFGKPTIDVKKLKEWKDNIVLKLTGGLGQISKLRKVNYIQGTATFVDSNTLNVQRADGSTEKIKFDKAVIATGSHPITLPFAPKSKHVLDSTSALDIDAIPRSLLLIGAGYIGLELGTVYAELGTEVSVVEMLDGIIPGADRDLARELEKRLKTIFKSIMVSTKVLKIDETKNGLKAYFEDKDGKPFEQTYEKILVAIGRRPNSKNLGLENTHVTLDAKGFIEKNAQLRTNDPNIYAIGDVAGNPMLAHKASHEGRVAIEAIAGHKVAFEPIAIPAVVFTDPEIAWAGMTETDATNSGREFEIVKFPWAASGRALTLNRNDGFTKLIVETKTERLLGMAIVGPGAGELIAEGVLALEMGATITDLKLSIHPHPTLTETLMESAETFFGQSTHIYRPKKKS